MSEEIRFSAAETGLGGAETTRRTLLTGGGVLGALAMTSCCIMPLVLFSLGATGAWIGNLAALYPYKLYFLVPAVGFLAGGSGNDGEGQSVRGAGKDVRRYQEAFGFPKPR